MIRGDGMFRINKNSLYNGISTWCHLVFVILTPISATCIIQLLCVGKIERLLIYVFCLCLVGFSV